MRMATRGKGEGTLFKDSRGLWTARIELPGRNGERRRLVKRSKDKAVLTKWLAEQHAELGRVGDIETSIPTLEQWSAYWLDRIASRRVRPNTLAGYRASLAHLCRSIGKTRLDKLSPAHVRRAEDKMAEAGLSPTTVLLAHRTLAKSLSDARREGKIHRVVTELMDAPRRAAVDVKALAVDEALTVIRAAAEALTADQYDPLPVLWATYLLTACRRGELLGLETDRIGDFIDVSWQLQRITKGSPLPADYEARQIDGGLWWTRPKTRHGWRAIPAAPFKSLLTRHLDRAEANPYGLVFTLEGRPIDPSRASALWTAWAAEHGIKGVTLHGLRHTTVDLLYELGVPEDVITEIVGHSQRAVTRGYKTPTKIARREEAMRALTTRLGL